MKLSKKEVEYLYQKKLKEGLTPKEAYAQVHKALEYQKKIKKRKQLNADDEKEDIKDFKQEFAKLRSNHKS